MRKQLNVLALVCPWYLFSCDHPISLETRVGEDGSCTKSILFEKTDSSVLRGNMFGVSESQGWKVTVQTIEGEKSKERFRIKFEKDFTSSDEVNASFDSESDTLFHIRTKWEKERRWFYTYIRYEETIRPINRFKGVVAEDFFNEEDRQFIRRLPPDGTSLSKPDNIFLKNLDNKITDHYAAWAIYTEQMDILKRLVIRSGLESRWLDTLKKHEDRIYKAIEDDKGDTQGDEQIAMRVAAMLGIPLPDGARRWADSLSADFNARIRFMAYAGESHVSVAYELPWAIMETNADSTAGNRAYWRLRPQKFMLTDHTLYAEARTPNVLGMVVGGVLLIVTLLILFRKGIMRNRF